MMRTCDAVVDGNTVYFLTSLGGTIYSFDVTGTNDSWTEIASCPYGSTITIINGCLTSIGGNFSCRCVHSRADTEYFNELCSLTDKDGERRWIKIFPPMPTKRSHATALCVGDKLIVAEGERNLQGGSGMAALARRIDAKFQNNDPTSLNGISS